MRSMKEREPQLKSRTLYPGVCYGCGEKFFSTDNRQKFCSRACANKYRDTWSCRHYGYKAIAAKKKRERDEHFAERDKKAASWLGKDADGDTRGRVPGGNTNRNGDGLFGRWY